MNKTIIIILALVVAISLIFGCTQTNGTDTNSQQPIKVTTSADAAKAINDVSSDISGISNSLNDIDNTFSDTNA